MSITENTLTESTLTDSTAAESMGETAPPVEPIALGAPNPGLLDRPTIGLPGRAATERRNGQPTTPYDRPDIALVERDGADWSLVGASARGLQHAFASEPRQDAFGVSTDGATLCIVVADGVGSFARSHEAADAAVALATAGMSRGEESEAVVKEVNDHLRVLADDGDGPLATTILLARVDVVDGDFVLDLAWVGDPSVWALTDGGLELVTVDESPTDEQALATTVSAALPAGTVAVRRRTLTVEARGIFFMTDGVGVPLEGIRAVRETLACWWSARPTVFEFAAQVEFARRGYMDDRTVVGVWPKRGTAGAVALAAGGDEVAP